MQVLLVFLVVCFAVGGSAAGRRVRAHPIVLLAFATLTAASFYSLRFVL